MRQTIKRLMPSWASNVLGRVRHPWTTKPSPAVARAERQVWSIGIYRCSGPLPLHFDETPVEANPVLTGADICDASAAFVADPFMLSVGNHWYMFFEVLDSRTNKGSIGLASSQDAVHWKYEQIVLAEAFHLSYPYVFAHDRQYYMVPESCQARSVRLYHAVDFPKCWTLEAILVDGADFVDPSLVFHEGKWWMFAAVGPPPFRAQTLHLFYAEQLTGPWRPHPQSPIVANDARFARPAGRVLALGDHVLRYAQDCSHTYGRAVQAFEILALTPTHYQERSCSEKPVLAPGGAAWNEEGMHHLDPHPTGNGAWIACVDGCSLRSAASRRIGI